MSDENVSVSAMMRDVMQTPPNASGESEPVHPNVPANSEPLDSGPASNVRIQNRTDDGKFDEGFQEQKIETAETPVEGEGEGAAQVEGEGAATSVLEPIEPPALWTLDDQNTFRKMSPQNQRFVMSQISALQNQTSAMPQDLDQLLSPRIEGWERVGHTPASAVNYLLSVSDYAETNPAEFIQWFANQRGINLNQLSQTSAPTQQQQQSALDNIDPNDPVLQDPVVKALLDHVAQLQGQVEQINGHMTNSQQQQQQYQQTQEQAERQQIATEIESFRMAADETGALKHPYFDQVRNLMSGIIGSSEVEISVDDAYMQACRAHPEVSQKIEAAEKAAKDSAALRAEREKAVASQTAGSSVSGTAGSTAPPAPTGDLRQDLRDAFANKGVLPQQSSMI